MSKKKALKYLSSMVSGAHPDSTGNHYKDSQTALNKIYGGFAMNEHLKFFLGLLFAGAMIVAMTMYLDNQIKERHEQYLLEGYTAKKECINYQIVYTRG